MMVEYLKEVILVQIRMGGYLYQFCKSGKVYKLKFDGKKYEILSALQVDK